MPNEQAKHPFLVLRDRIREATTQYRHNSDNSESLFHPDKGFVYGYDLAEVEQALTEYEKTLPTAFIDVEEHLSKEDELIQMGSRLVATTEEESALEFAQEIVAYLVGAQLEKKGQVLELARVEAEGFTPASLGDYEDLEPGTSESS